MRRAGENIIIIKRATTKNAAGDIGNRGDFNMNIQRE